MAKSNPLFDTLNYICTKQYKWEELPDDCRKNYSQFMINRFLSSYEYLIPLVNELSISKTLSDKQHYTILYTWVKRTKHYFNYNAYKASKTDTNLVIGKEGIWGRQPRGCQVYRRPYGGNQGKIEGQMDGLYKVYFD